MLVIFFTGLDTIAQKESTYWYFGRKAGVQFTNAGPVALSNSAMITGKGCASVSHRCSGELLFYTDGDTIWNRNHVAMTNGTGLLGNVESTQSAIIVENPDTSTKEYYIFTVGAGSSGGLNYTVVDMNLSGGLGAVVTTKKNIPLVNPTLEKVSGVKHGNNHDYWIITHKLDSYDFYAYLLTDSGVSPTPVISTTANYYDNDALTGYMKASPTGNKLALALKNNKRFDLYDFDVQTGEVSNPVNFPDNYDGAYGVEFSPDGSKLYTTKNSFGLYQFDLDAGTPGGIVASEVLISTVPNVAIQLALDGKIYTNEGNDLGVINAPNSPGFACNYVPAVLPLGAGVFGNSGLPTFIQSYFSPLSIHANGLCFGADTEFGASVNGELDSLVWNFGDALSTSNTSKLINPTHVFSSPGTYTVTATSFITICGAQKTETATKLVTIVDTPVPDAFIGNDTIICPGNTVNLSVKGGEPQYLWNDGSTDSTLSNATSGMYWVEITNVCGTESDTIVISDFVTSLNVNLGEDTAICERRTIEYNVSQNALDYVWQDSIRTAVFTVSDAGKYWVEVSDKCYSASDTVIVSIKDAPEVRLANDTILCNGRQVVLDAFYQGASYSWQDGSDSSKFVVSEGGRYDVVVSNECGDAADKTYVEYEDCSCHVFVPNTFTPNSDLINDGFNIVFDCRITDYNMKIYDRWGKLFFETNHPETVWDGNIKGEPAPGGVYVYKVAYKAINNAEDLEAELEGIITLTR